MLRNLGYTYLGFRLINYCFVLEKCVENGNIAFESVKETKVQKELFSRCSISIFAAFIR